MKPLTLAQAYISDEKGVARMRRPPCSLRDGCTGGAVQRRCVHPRKALREFYRRTGMLRSVHRQGRRKRLCAVRRLPEGLRAAGHRILAVNRGEREEWLKVSVECDDESACKSSARGRRAGQRML
ncbi:MAG: hypothetical protein V8Q79_04525 [Christensenellales bacterium]